MKKTLPISIFLLALSACALSLWPPSQTVAQTSDSESQIVDRNSWSPGTVGSGATNTGSGVRLTQPDVGTYTIMTQSGTLFYQFSNNNTDWYSFPPSGFQLTPNTPEFHTAVKLGRFFRVKITNSTTTGATLDHVTYFGTFRQGNAPLNQTLSQDSDAITVRAVDTMLDVSAGRFGGFTPVNKFGRAPTGLQTEGTQAGGTDIWDRADATPTQSRWLAPTAARVHAIVSSDASDDSDDALGGAYTVRVYGLQTWDSKETSEVVTLNGTASVNTVNSYVIIHRMTVETHGGVVNAGTITATAATDSTVTAAILPERGQTEMAIYGIPSTQKAYITQFYSTIDKQGGAVGTANIRLMVNGSPDTGSGYIIKNVRGLQSTGTSSDTWGYNPYFVVDGPAIIKMNGISSADDIEATGGFDMILVDD